MKSANMNFHWLVLSILIVGINCLPREKRSPQFFHPGGLYGGYGFGGGPYGYGGPGYAGFDFYNNPRPFGRARCRLIPANKTQVMGEFFLDQPQSIGPVQISGEVVNLEPGRHGLSINEMGETGDDCAAAGGHFNPNNMKHGAPDQPHRHAGDLGNIQAGANKAARIEIVDSEISLVEGNPRNVMGKSIVVYAMEDDLGRGEGDESAASGNTGDRIACCVIERPTYWY